MNEVEDLSGIWPYSKWDCRFPICPSFYAAWTDCVCNKTVRNYVIEMQCRLWDSAGAVLHSTRFNFTVLQPSKATFAIRGHPFITSTRRGRGSGSGGRVWTGVKPHVDVHTKLKLESTDVILSFFSCKEFGIFFTRISSLDGIKSGIFSAI